MTDHIKHITHSKLKEYKKICFQSNICLEIIKKSNKDNQITTKELSILNKVRYSENY